MGDFDPLFDGRTKGFPHAAGAPAPEAVRRRIERLEAAVPVLGEDELRARDENGYVSVPAVITHGEVRESGLSWGPIPTIRRLSGSPTTASWSSSSSTLR
jgi:hypothetical protein